MTDQSQRSSVHKGVSSDMDAGVQLSVRALVNKDDLLAALLKAGRGQPGWLYAIAQDDELYNALKSESLHRSGQDKPKCCTQQRASSKEAGSLTISEFMRSLDL